MTKYQMCVPMAAHLVGRLTNSAHCAGTQSTHFATNFTQSSIHNNNIFDIFIKLTSVAAKTFKFLHKWFPGFS